MMTVRERVLDTVSPRCSRFLCPWTASRAVVVGTADSSSHTLYCSTHARQVVSVLTQHAVLTGDRITRVACLPLAKGS
jgi:NAD(P)H-dependent FMN reductase